MKLTLEDLFGKWITHKDATEERKQHGKNLVDAANRLISYAELDGVEFKINPATRSIVSGATLGGFRPQDCTVGASKSSHKQGLAVDLYDPDNKIDAWCMKNFKRLEECGIYIEHPSATSRWSHWTIRAPASGNRAFYP